MTPILKNKRGQVLNWTKNDKKSRQEKRKGAALNNSEPWVKYVIQVLCLLPIQGHICPANICVWVILS